jgi:hypothetical protein
MSDAMPSLSTMASDNMKVCCQVMSILRMYEGPVVSRIWTISALGVYRCFDSRICVKSSDLGYKTEILSRIPENVLYQPILKGYAECSGSILMHSGLASTRCINGAELVRHFRSARYIYICIS